MFGCNKFQDKMDYDAHFNHKDLAIEALAYELKELRWSYNELHKANTHNLEQIDVLKSKLKCYFLRKKYIYVLTF